MTALFYFDKPFVLESGKTIPSFHLAYTTSGILNEKGDNVVWVFHALTANSDPAEWWYGLFGDEKLFDAQTYFTVCVNMPGSCYGSIGPLQTNPLTGEFYYHDFPLFTTRDMVRAYSYLRHFLSVKKIHIGIGGSMGGQQLLEWAVEEPALFEYIIPIATNARHSPWGIAFNASQRLCIEADATWKNRESLAGIDGMKTARSIALLSYRNYHTYQYNQDGITGDSESAPVDAQVFRAESYQRYQGEKLAKRFDAFSYFFLSKSMDAHDIGRGRGSLETALQGITAKALVIGIETDILFPVPEQDFLAKHIPGASIVIINSLYGHDGFLLEFEKISEAISAFLQKVTVVNSSVSEQID